MVRKHHFCLFQALLGYMISIICCTLNFAAIVLQKTPISKAKWNPRRELFRSILCQNAIANDVLPDTAWGNGFWNQNGPGIAPRGLRTPPPRGLRTWVDHPLPNSALGPLMHLYIYVCIYIYMYIHIAVHATCYSCANDFV